MIASLVTRGNAFFEVYRTKPQGICDLAKKGAQTMNIVDFPEICPIPATSGEIEDQVMNFEQLMSAGIPGRIKVEVVLAHDKVEKARAILMVTMK